MIYHLFQLRVRDLAGVSLVLQFDLRVLTSYIVNLGLKLLSLSPSPSPSPEVLWGRIVLWRLQYSGLLQKYRKMYWSVVDRRSNHVQLLLHTINSILSPRPQSDMLEVYSFSVVFDPPTIPSACTSGSVAHLEPSLDYAAPVFTREGFSLARVPPFLPVPSYFYNVYTNTCHHPSCAQTKVQYLQLYTVSISKSNHAGESIL